ncbi:hypothetical protein EJ04DRAFT_79143 [Polyplosphaeria fusca]|uniref:Protein kinase domain-containing protein n=1 Tax=Polyplosphaeria fusca TaxID=682080 RepID=A0A9P4R6V5_9PLEO|nr:hypothetical protein EJ04DRAFT_79143 [Polyplosphaeria fusca]
MMTKLLGSLMFCYCLVIPRLSLAQLISSPSPLIDCSLYSPVPNRVASLSYHMCATSTPGREYWYLNHIGTGAASSVVKAAWTPPHQRFMQCQPADASWYTISDTQKAPRSVAIKIFDRPPSDVPNRRYAQNIRDEFDFMQQLSHPNIVQTYELIESGGRFFGVLELCTQSLMSFMGNIEPEQGLVDTIWGSIVEAVRFMHSVRISTCSMLNRGVG